MKNNAILALLLFSLYACKKGENMPPAAENQLMFSFRFDQNQPRLNNIGQPAPIPQDHAAQTPGFQAMSVHYIELAPNALTQLGKGAILYQGIETDAGGSPAVDFDKALVAGENEVFTKINLKDVPPGTYEWVRVSVTYQNYDMKFNLKNVPLIGNLDNQTGTIASFVGFNTYLTQVVPRAKPLAVNAEKKQGFWAFETSFSAPYDAYNSVFSGDAPAGATTVVNPLFQTSPIPPGSCVVTGKFSEPLIITGNESSDVEVALSFSINNSFEWEDANGNGQWDVYADDPSKNEKVVDMGLRGLLPVWQK
jgi:hypothetical protein